MAFTFNGHRPDKIVVNDSDHGVSGAELNVLKYNGYAVWGKKFALTLSQGTGTTLSVSRTSSPNEHAATGALSNGAAIYYGDVLSVSVSANTGYQSATTSGFTSGGSVTGNVTISSSATVKSYTLTLSQGTGTTLSVSRTSSPLKGAATGALSSGSTIYHGDVLSVSCTATSGYKNPTYSGFTSGSSVSGNVSITSSATAMSWHTVYSGSLSGVTSHNNFATITNGLVNYTSPTRISGSALWYENNTTNGNYGTPSFSEVELGSSAAIIPSTIHGDQNIASDIRTKTNISLLRTFFRSHVHAFLSFAFIPIHCCLLSNIARS